MSEKASKGRLFAPDNSGSKITLTKEKERRKRKSEEEERRREKSNGCTLSFYSGYLGDSQLVFCEKKPLLDAKGPFGGNLFKNPAKYTFVITLVEQIKSNSVDMLK